MRMEQKRKLIVDPSSYTGFQRRTENGGIRRVGRGGAACARLALLGKTAAIGALPGPLALTMAAHSGSVLTCQLPYVSASVSPAAAAHWAARETGAALNR